MLLCPAAPRQVVVKLGERRKASAAARGNKEVDAIATDEARFYIFVKEC